MNHIEWKQSNPCVPGPVTWYGYWEGAKAFSIYTPLTNKSDKPNPTPYALKSVLPGFRPDLPQQKTVAEAQAFAERMLQRWVAKRGLLFKSHIVVTDAMLKAAQDQYEGVFNKSISTVEIDAIVKAAIAARG